MVEDIVELALFVAGVLPPVVEELAWGRNHPIEGRRAQDQHALGVIKLVPHAGEWCEAQLGAGRVQRREMRIPHGPALPPDRRMHLPFVLVAGRGEARPEGRQARGGQRIDVGEHGGHRQHRGFGGDLGAEKERARHNGVGPHFADRARGLSRIGGGGSADEPLAQPRDQLRRGVQLEVAQVVVLRATRAQVGRLAPRPKVSAGRRCLRLDRRIGEDRDAVTALDQCTREGQLRRNRAGPVPEGEEIVAGHGSFLVVERIARTMSVMIRWVARRPWPRSRRSSFQV